VASWKDAGVNRGRHGSRGIIFGKVALAMFSKSQEATPDRLAHIAATLSQGQEVRSLTIGGWFGVRGISGHREGSPET
jgi:hypothetical protein